MRTPGNSFGPNRDEVLVFSAHADDETLGVGGFLARCSREGRNVVVAVATDSASAQYAGDEKAILRRRRHMDEAMQILGVKKIEWLGAPDMALSEYSPHRLRAWCEGVVASHRPQIVLSPWGNDINADHRVLTQAVGVACRPRPGSPVKRLLEYETLSATEWGSMMGGHFFCPNAWLDISGELQVKLGALSRYADELRPWPHPRSIEAAESLAKYRGSQVGVSAAEALVVRYSIE